MFFYLTDFDVYIRISYRDVAGIDYNLDLKRVLL